MGLIEEVKDGDTDSVFELMLKMNNGEISIDLDEIIESIMFSLYHGDPKIWMANKFENTLNYFFNYKYNETKYYLLCCKR